MNKRLQSLANALKVVRDEDPEMPAQTLATILQVSLNPGASQKRIQEILGVSSSTMTRIVSRLGEWERVTKPGAGMIVTERDPADRRYQLLWLTTKGQKFVKRLEDGMD